MSEITKYIPFDNRQFPVYEVNGKHLVAMKPLVEAIGLDWDKQLELIKRDEILGSTTAIIGVVAEDGKTRDMVCLPEEYLQGWLFKVPSSRYEGERKEKLLFYKRECYKALHDYWTKVAEVNQAATMKQLKAMGSEIRPPRPRRMDRRMEGWRGQNPAKMHAKPSTGDSLMRHIPYIVAVMISLALLGEIVACIIGRLIK